MVPGTALGVRFPVPWVFSIPTEKLCKTVAVVSVTGREVLLSRERTFQVRLDDLIHGPADLGNDLDTGDPEGRLERAGDGRADQDVDIKRAEPLNPVGLFEVDIYLPGHFVFFDLHHPHMSCDVEDGRDPANPDR